MVANRHMKTLLKRVENFRKTEQITIKMQNLENLFNPPFKQVSGCVILADEDVESLEKGFKRAIHLYKDRTGYEACNTETRINDYFENKLSIVSGTAIALMVCEIWAMRLKCLEPDSKFCIILCSNDERVELRFHKVRDNEKSWLDSDIDSYTEGAVGYIYV